MNVVLAAVQYGGTLEEWCKLVEQCPSLGYAPVYTEEGGMGYCENVCWKLKDGCLTICSSTLPNIFPRTNWLNCRDKIQKVVVEEGVTKLFNSSFFQCKNLTQVQLPQSLTWIDSVAFAGCVGLETLELPDSLEEMGNDVFDGCVNLKTLNLPDSLTKIGSGVFRECEKLNLLDASAAPTQVSQEYILLNDFVSLPQWFREATQNQAQLEWQPVSGNGKVTNGYGGTQDCVLRPTGTGKLVLKCVETYTHASVTIELQVLGSYQIRPADVLRLTAGDRYQLSVWLFPDAIAQQNVAWSVEEDTYAYISASGLLVARPVQQAGQVTVVATLEDGFQVTKTFLVYPKTQALALYRGDQQLGDTLSVDMCAGTGFNLSAYPVPGDAQSRVSWSSSQTKVATIEQSGKVTLIAPGTTVLTAVARDGSNVRAKLTLTVYYADPAKKLQLCPEELPAVGLQPGQSVRLALLGNDRIPAEHVSFEIPAKQSEIATVDENGVLTAGNKTGSVTVTATIPGDPLKRKATCKVTVIAMQAQTISVSAPGAQEGNLIIDGDTLKTGGKLPLRVEVLDYAGEKMEGAKLKWTSSDSTVAKVTVNKNGTVDLVIPAGASGETCIQAQATDKQKAAGQLYVSVRNYAPRISSRKLQLNSYMTQGTELTLLGSYGYQVQSVQLRNADTVTENRDFTAALDGTRLTIGTRSVLNNGTHSLLLEVTSRYEEKVRTDRIPLTVIVKNSLPKVTVKQQGKLDLAYMGSQASLKLTPASGEVEYVSMDGCSGFQLLGNGGDATVQYVGTSGGKVNTKATLYIELKNYRVRAEAKLTLATTKSKYPAKLSAQSGMVNLELGDTATVQLLGVDMDKTIVWTDSSLVSIQVSGNTLRMSLLGKTGGKVPLYVQGENWAEPQTLTYTIAVNTKMPTAKLASTTLKLNSRFPQTVAESKLTLSHTGLVPEEVRFAFTGKAAQQKEAQKLTLRYLDGCVVAGIEEGQTPANGTYSYAVTVTLPGGKQISAGTVKLSVANTLPKLKLSATRVKLNQYLAGEETASVTVTAGDAWGYTLVGFRELENFPELGFDGTALTFKLSDASDTGRTYALTPVFRMNGKETDLPMKVTVKTEAYYSQKIGVKVTAKGKLDMTQPGQKITYTIGKLTNCLGSVDAVSLAGADRDDFTLEKQTVNGTWALSLRDDCRYNPKQTYQIQLLFTVCGREVPSQVFKLKVSQSAVKVTAAPASQVVYQSQSQPVSWKLTTVPSAPAEQVRINSRTAAALRAVLHEEQLVLDGNTLTLKNVAWNKLPAGKTYPLILDVLPHTLAETGKPVQLTLSIQVKK